MNTAQVLDILKDAALIGSVYHPDAHDDHGGRTFRGSDAGASIIEWLRESRVEMGSHHITNLTITIDGDTAACESYYSGFMLECHDDGAQRQDAPRAEARANCHQPCRSSPEGWCGRACRRRCRR